MFSLPLFSLFTSFLLLFLSLPPPACSLRLSPLRTLDRPWAGVVEVFANDEWGRVCSEDWGLSEANIVCKNLGFEGAIEARGEVSDPQTDLYWLAGVNCSGSETGLCDCLIPNGITNSNCADNSDAGVLCQSEHITPLIRMPMEQKKVPIVVIEVSLFQGLNCLQELFWRKRRCPY